MNAPSTLPSVFAVSLLSLPAVAQIPDPLIDPPNQTATYTGYEPFYQPDPTDAFWVQSSFKPTTNHALEPAHDYRWGLDLDFGAYVGDVHPVDKVTYYGLFVQEVSTMALGQSCDESFSWFNWFTYYEYKFISDGPGGGMHDVFGSGHWDMSPGAAEKGFVRKIGVAKFIPIFDGELDTWFAQGDSAKPPAVKAWEGMVNDPGWNSQVGEDGRIPVLDANGDAQIASPHSIYDFTPTEAHSGLMPNRPDKPAGWDTDFDGHAQTIVRDFHIWWNYCEPAVHGSSGDDETDGEESGSGGKGCTDWAWCHLAEPWS